jgi:hypothetical protein
VHVCKFTSLQVYKFANLQNKLNNLEITNLQLCNCKCAFASSQVCKFTKLKNPKKLIINNYNFTTLQIASVHLQVHKFASMQVCKFAKLKNLKKFRLIIIILQLCNLQVRICKFTSLQIYKTKKY